MQEHLPSLFKTKKREAMTYQKAWIRDFVSINSNFDRIVLTKNVELITGPYVKAAAKER